MTAAVPRVVNAPTSREHHNPGIHKASVPVSNATSAELVLTPASRAWRRRLGALAWAALEDLALAAHGSEQGWVAPVGVRAVASSIGVTKDTAARAIAALGAVEFVVLQRVEGRDGRHRSGYRLRLPDGLELRTCPNRRDIGFSAMSGSCPTGEDRNCPKRDDPENGPVRPDSPPADQPTRQHQLRPDTGKAVSDRPEHRPSTDGAIQPTLFAPAIAAKADTCRDIGRQPW